MRIIWSPTSKIKINDILEYISEDNPGVALNLIDDFELKIEKLKENPELGRVLPEINNTNIRELIVHDNYGIIYEVNPDIIEILTVRHFKQNFSSSSL